MKATISRKTKYTPSDGWRGVTEPINAVAGANDTGMYDDSPCRSDICKRELNSVKTILKNAGIKCVTMACNSSNVFMIRRFVLTAPEDRKRALELIKPLVHDTTLLYTCGNSEGNSEVIPPSKDDGMAHLKTVAMVAKMGDLLGGNTQKEKNDWKLRMIKAGLEGQGLIMPDDWDSLTEDQKEERLNGIIGILSDKK